MTIQLDKKFYLRDRFQRSTRIDGAKKDELDGFILHETGRNIICRFLKEIGSGTQRAFTWTGPYGSGKSTLALYLSRLLSGTEDERRQALHLIGKRQINSIEKFNKDFRKKWLVLNITAQKEDISKTILDAIKLSVFDFWGEQKGNKILEQCDDLKTDNDLIEFLLRLSDEATINGGGLLLILDEMGKAIEYASRLNGDLYLFQEIAEQFSRANSTCACLGILHQSFEEYANRSDRAQRKEWAKVQGRYEDTPFSVSIEESIELIGKAIKGPRINVAKSSIIDELLKFINSPRLANHSALAKSLAACVPLDPLTSLLLPAISRQKFGQNERSVFSFLSSGELNGFKDYLAHTEYSDDYMFYQADKLWDYLEVNLQQVILASPIGHRWSEANEALLRAEERGQSLHVKLTKIVALLDLFGRPFLLNASEGLLQVAASEPQEIINKALSDLGKWSVLAFRKHLGAWVISSGSDIDIEQEIEKIRPQMENDINSILQFIPEQRPVVANRHYVESGTLRWYPIKAMTPADLKIPENREVPSAADGMFIVLVADEKVMPEDILKLSREINLPGAKPIIIGLSSKVDILVDRCSEFATLCRIEDRVAEIQTDKVARRELKARMDQIISAIALSYKDVLSSSDWVLNGETRDTTKNKNLTQLASEISDEIYIHSPRLMNELINRNLPSGTSNSARRKLMYAMIDAPHKEGLGIDKYPPEKGLYLSLLNNTHLHIQTDKGSWKFIEKNIDKTPEIFVSLWDKTTEKITETAKSRTKITLSELYELWSLPPFGIKTGVLPILALVYLLSNKSELAVYINGIFEYKYDDLFVDHILQSPANFALMHAEPNEDRVAVLDSLSEFTTKVMNNSRGKTALASAQSLAQFAHKLPNWTKRTFNISAEALRVREALIRAQDPEKLLFDDLPSAFGMKEGLREASDQKTLKDFISKLEKAYLELTKAYGEMLENVRRTFCEAFGLPDDKPESLAQLKIRAKNISKKSGDMKLDALIGRIEELDLNSNKNIANVAGLILGKNVADWIDIDLLDLAVKTRQMGQKFEVVEAFSKLSSKGGQSNSVAVYINGSKALREYHKSLPTINMGKSKAQKNIKALEEEIKKLGIGENNATSLLIEMLEQRLKKSTDLGDNENV